MTGTEENDDIRGMGGSDLVANNGSDPLSGGRGADSIDALEASSNGGVDTVVGGVGNDEGLADDEQRDVIDCGKGTRDEVRHDVGIDVKKNREINDAP